MRAKAAIFIVLALLFNLWSGHVYADIPPDPHAFWGDLTIDGYPAPVGTEVEARGDGVLTGIEGNPLIATEEGKYGGPDVGDLKLLVQGDVLPNTIIRFYINGADTGQTYLFHTGNTTKLDLSVTITAPSVTTNAATSITTTSATLNGNLLSLGAASSVNVSFEWGETIGYGAETPAETINSTGAFSFNLTDLSPNTTYHFRAKVVGDGIAWGDDNIFTTLEAVSQAGNANGDGNIDVLDMTKVARIILLLDPETPGADANGDGVVNVLDMTKIARIILMLD